MKKIIILILILINLIASGRADQRATIREEKIKLLTYMFSGPNPVPEMGRIYPYFRFEGYTNKGVFREWNMVVLENDFIKVYVCPEIGGKVWGAVEKSTGKEFIYFNHTVKFRDIGMRGAWTSGGLEYNFGDIGHIPTCATPVDYNLSENPDGSVSCSVGAIDLPSGTKWNVNITLPKDGAYFKTISSWFNKSPLPVTYYHWMNAAAKAEGNLEFIYPGNKWIGHGGEFGEWPVQNGKDLSFYKNNNFGNYKSYHVINSYSDYMGGYWHDDDFGFGHLSDYDDKPGKKIWIWGLSDQGMIWERLLTDKDGQYVEYQSGKLFNQAAAGSTFSPFKHREFLSYDTDVMKEIWFPLKGTKGMVAASEHVVLNVIRKKESVKLLLSSLKNIDADLMVSSEDNIILKERIKLKPLNLFTKVFKLKKNRNFFVQIGDEFLNYSSKKEDLLTDRPVKTYKSFDWRSAYGLYVKALESEKQRKYSEAMELYKKSLNIENTFLPSLNRMALGYYRRMNYKTALDFSLRSLSIDTYDPLANYIFGLANIKLGKRSDAKNGFSIASQSIKFRPAAYTELAKIFLNEGRLNSSKKYAKKALTFNAGNLSALEILAIIFRKQNKKKEADKILAQIYHLDQTGHFIDFEKLLWKSTTPDIFKRKISTELPHELYLDLAASYYNFGCIMEALEILDNSPEHPIVYLWRSFLDKKKRETFLKKALELSAELVFPFRVESAKFLNYFIKRNGHWKLKYYLGLIYWNRGLVDKAKELFELCGDKPGFFPFYLAKIKLFPKNKKVKARSLKKALDLNGSALEVNLSWINYYMESADFEKAERLAEINVKNHPEKSVFGLLYARILLKLKKFNECRKFLEKYIVLPYEGATEGRNIYHETCVRAAYKELGEKNYSKAVSYAKKAKLWPSNLGVGKPYDVDDRLDNFLIAYGYEKLGKQSESDKYYLKIINHKTPLYLSENSKLYIQAIVLKKTGEKKKALDLIESAIKNFPGNIYTEWVRDIFINGMEKGTEYNMKNQANNTLLGEKKFKDREFELVTDLFKIIKKIKTINKKGL